MVDKCKAYQDCGYISFFRRSEVKKAILLYSDINIDYNSY